MNTKSLIQNSFEIANKKQQLLEKANEYLNTYDIENLYIGIDSKQVSINNIQGIKNFSQPYSRIEEAINKMTSTDILYIYKGEDKEYKFRVLS